MANKYINKAFDLNSTGAITIYTVPAETVAIVKVVQGYNDTASAVTVTMSLPMPVLQLLIILVMQRVALLNNLNY